jgi:hypothetical protein
MGLERSWGSLIAGMRTGHCERSEAISSEVEGPGEIASSRCASQ